MKTCIFLYICLLFNLNAVGQNICKCEDEYSANEQMEDKLNGQPYNNPLSVFNEQYFNVQFANSDIALRNGSVVKNKFLKYNSYLDELIWLRNKDYKQIILNKDDINEFSLFTNDSSHLYHFKKIKIKNWYETDSIDAFLQVLVEGRYSLYVLRKIYLHRNTFEFYKYYQYYIKKPDGILYNVKLTKKDLQNTLIEIKDDVKSTIRRHGFKARNEEDLAWIIREVNKKSY